MVMDVQPENAKLWDIKPVLGVNLTALLLYIFVGNLPVTNTLFMYSYESLTVTPQHIGGTVTCIV